jgi:D-aminoacyl-tRNA deacylase
LRALVQRVTFARVVVEESVVGEIGRGLLVLLGVGRGDAEQDLAYVLKKVVGLRVFADDAGKMNRSVVDVGGALLVVSQFTLYANVQKGQRPGFDDAMPPTEARAMVDAFVAEARKLVPVETGRFGADMRVTLENDGPVTLLIDSAVSRRPAG